MADYEDQNSSEYKDMNQETQAADQNPQNPVLMIGVWNWLRSYTIDIY